MRCRPTLCGTTNILPFEQSSSSLAVLLFHFKVLLFRVWLKQVTRFREGSCSASVISSPHVGGAGSFWYFLGKMKTFFVMNSVCRMKDENNKSATQIQDMPRHDNLIWCLSLLLHRGSRFLRKVFSLLPLGLETELPYLSMKYNQGSSKKKRKKSPTEQDEGGGGGVEQV